jgi:hypothetical protein
MKDNYDIIAGNTKHSILNKTGWLLISLLRKGRRICLAVFLVQLLILSAGPAGASGEEPSVEKKLGLPHRKWIGDLDGMVKRRLIRALVSFSKTNYLNIFHIWF